MERAPAGARRSEGSLPRAASLGNSPGLFKPEVGAAPGGLEEEREAGWGVRDVHAALPCARGGEATTATRTHAPPSEATRPGPQRLALDSSAVSARPSRPTTARTASAAVTPLCAGLIKKKQLQGASLPCGSSCLLQAPNPGMVGRWHARFCQEPLHW